MKKYILIVVLSTLLIFLIFSVFYLLWSFRNLNSLPEFIEENHTEQNLSVEQQDLSWQQELAQWPVRDFSPAVEQFSLHFNVDTTELKEKTKYFQLIINKYDVFSMFCLRKTLDLFKVKYFLLKSGESPEIIVDTQNKKLVEDIMKELQKYEINTEMKEIWL